MYMYMYCTINFLIKLFTSKMFLNSSLESTMPFTFTNDSKSSGLRYSRLSDRFQHFCVSLVLNGLWWEIYNVNGIEICSDRSHTQVTQSMYIGCAWLRTRNFKLYFDLHHLYNIPASFLPSVLSSSQMEVFYSAEDSYYLTEKPSV